ncbi:hypothetical protein RvY_07563-1 [Ramazzottius varieornatus]|uniref:Calponin-homology (CH) domain-containing protein n=1 Tax=Ramazzottius varieornatus TaxID=947166 RepID=A0A1D1VC31_RAMVA|nr:hypothetical protein RvY_07563-1 [Ramazzottius varieornatus]
MPHEYGLTDQMNKRIAAKRDASTEQAALRWIFGILGESLPQDQPFENVLHDGTVLARFMKKIRPDLLPQKINTNNIEASQRENIGNFIQAASKLGLRSYEIFQTNDLYDKKDIPQVTVCLNALGTKLQETNPDLPAFGPPPKRGSISK